MTVVRFPSQPILWLGGLKSLTKIRIVALNTSGKNQILLDVSEGLTRTAS